MQKEDIKEQMKKFMEEQEKESAPVREKKKVKHEIDKTKHAEYFEGQLQMRGINKEILEYVQKRIIKAGAQVPTSIHHSRHDIDYFVSDRRLIHKIGKELKNKFGGTVRESAQLFSRNHLTSKNVYRLNLIYKTHDIKIGSLLLLEGFDVPYRVTGYSGDKLIVEDVLHGKKTQIATDVIEKELERIKTSVVANHPELTILDSDFQPVYAKAAPGVTFSEGEKVKAVNSGNTWYVI